MHEEHPKHHIMPLWIYLAVGGALVTLTGLTVTASQINFTELTGIPSLNFFIAMLIATIKSTLVALFFMHLYYDSKFYMFCLFGAILCLMIFISLTLADIGRRGAVNSIERSPIQAQVSKDKFVESKHHESSEPEPAGSTH